MSGSWGPTRRRADADIWDFPGFHSLFLANFNLQLFSLINQLAAISFSELSPSCEPWPCGWLWKNSTPTCSVESRAVPSKFCISSMFTVDLNSPQLLKRKCPKVRCQCSPRPGDQIWFKCSALLLCLKAFFRKCIPGGEVDSVAKSTCYSSRTSVSSWHPSWATQPPVTPAPLYLMLFWPLHAHMGQAGTQIKISLWGGV